MGTPREHIESIRKNKYQIGVGTISVSRDLRMAVKYLSTELYSKDVHFLMELIQNAEDNQYEEGVEPSLEFLLTSEDITGTGAPTTLLVLNNEKGFTRRNMDSICSIGDSSKTGQRKRGYIGEKGIGFKSVFLLTSQPYIFSNGYQVRFSEQPCPYCDIAYIVPEWVDQNPTISDLEHVYGGSRLPTTTIVLPLKRDKVDSVKEQLSSIHREMILFLSKIKKLSVKETNRQSFNSLHAVSISSEKDFVAKKNIDAESFTLHLTSFEEENGEEEECSYYMWRQRFPVKQENRVERRIEVDEWSITLAFPYGQRLNRGMMEAGIYAFLPTEMVTNFPFIIQADFILQSSREKVVLDDPWNKGILSCVPAAFMDAFTSLVKCDNDAPLSSLARLFAFLPVKESSFEELNDVRKLIRQKVIGESIVPSESLSKQRFFHKPSDVGRVTPSFWNIVLKAKEQGVNFHNLSSHGKYILSSSLANGEYKDALAFLGVDYVDTEWYSRCIQSSNLVLGVDDNVYTDLLAFVSGNWSAFSKSPSIKSIPLLKYVASDGNLSLLSIRDVKSRNDSTLCRSQDSRYASWLIKWSKELKCAGRMFFLPEDTQVLCSKRDSLLAWLRDDVDVTNLTVYEYADELCRDDLGGDRRLLLAFSHFLHHSLSARYLSSSEVEKLCKSMQLIDSYGQIVRSRRGVLVPANGSIWVQLMNSNPWKAEGYVELHEDYLRSGYFGGQYCSEKELIEFLRSYVGASDIPDITPPNVDLTCVSAPLTKDNALILLGWIRKLRSRGIALPSNFLQSIKEGRWLRVSMNGSTGYRSPCQSFLHSSSWGALLQNASVMLDIPVIDQAHYDYKLSGYEEELKAIGVMSTYGEACEFIGEHLMNLAASSSLSKNSVMAMLGLIRFLREKYLPPDRLIASIKNGNWLRTSRGFRSPIGSVLFDGSWKVASEVSLIPFIDQEYYGEDILHYKKELELLGVIVEFNDESYQIVEHYLKPASELNYLTSATFILLLKCIRRCASSNKIVTALRAALCIKSDSGFRNPSQCFLRDPEWGCILQVFDSFPCIDSSFYGREILIYTAELRMIGVVVDYDNAVKAFVSAFEQKSSRSSFTKDQVFEFLDCYRNLRNIRRIAIPDDLKKCITKAKWLRTRLASRASPKDCILFGQEWESIAKITTLPFIDDSEKYYGRGIHDYKAELESIGVMVDYKKGAKFVVSHLYFPVNADEIAPASVYSLLNSVRQIKLLGNLPEQFLKKVSETKWLKTTFGYRSPAKCILYDKEWEVYFMPSDGPFIDENHYGSSIVSYKEELQTMGVIVRIEAGASLLVSHLQTMDHPLLSHFESIKRVYVYLDRYNWERTGEASDTIWIPIGNGGKWVSSGDCVLYNKNNLFSSRLIVLEKQYDSKLLQFFGRSFGVRSHPSMGDYCELWKDWESSSYAPSHDHCCSFWSYVVTHWNSKTERVLSETLTKVPASSSSGKIHLIDKCDAFIPDDLLLKDLFCNSSDQPLFVWTPQLSHPSIPRSKLLDVYRGIGIRTISSSVVRNECSPLSTSLNVTETRLSDVFIKKGLIILVLGFLADPVLDMNPVRRHETVLCLLKTTALETSEPIAMSYCLTLSSGSRLSESASRMVCWDRNDSKLFVQKLDRSEGLKNVVEFATNFAQVISEGLLWDKEDHIPRLSELIKFAFLVDFDVDAVSYYMKSKNLQMFVEDEEFLSSVYASE